MANLNMVILAGNLTRDPEIRYTPSGTAVASISLAINRRYKDSTSGEFREDTTYVDVDLWGRQAETAGQYLSKGRPVLIEGRLQLDRWEDRQTGQKRSKLKVVGNRFQFLGAGGGGGGGGGAPGGGGGGGGGRGQGRGQGGGRGRSQPDDQYDQSPPDDPNLDIPEDDIPF